MSDKGRVRLCGAAIASSLVLLGGCAGGAPPRPGLPGIYSTAGVPVTTESRVPADIAMPPLLRAGTGRVALVTLMNGVSTAGRRAGPAKRVILEMDDGTLQYLDTFDEYSPGQRIEILPDARIANVESKTRTR